MEKIIIVLMLVLASCVPVVVRPSVTPKETGRVEIYKVGDFTFRLYSDHRTLIEDLKRLRLPLLDPELLGKFIIEGNHDKTTKTIFAVKDVYVLLHELKHILEPEWVHSIPCDKRACLSPISE